jgi:hypothetical protein
MKGKRSFIDRVVLNLVKVRRVASVDTQAIRKKLLDQLDGLFQFAISIAKCKVKNYRDDDEEHSVSAHANSNPIRE